MFINPFGWPSFVHCPPPPVMFTNASEDNDVFIKHTTFNSSNNVGPPGPPGEQGPKGEQGPQANKALKVSKAQRETRDLKALLDHQDLRVIQGLKEKRRSRTAWTCRFLQNRHKINFRIIYNKSKRLLYRCCFKRTYYNTVSRYSIRWI